MRKGNAIRISELAHEMQTIMAEFQDLCDEALDEAVTETGEEVVKTVSSNAPDDTGDYKRSITFGDKKLYARTVEGVVYATDPDYRLTHLLEFGHAMKRYGQKYGKGKTSAHPHWIYGENQAKTLLEKKLKEKIEK